MPMDFGYDEGFDIYPQIEDTPEDQARWKAFLDAVRQHFRYDPSVVFDRSPGIAAQFGPCSTWDEWLKQGAVDVVIQWPLLTANGIPNMRFAVKLNSGYPDENRPQARPYIKQLAQIARRTLGEHRVHAWENGHPEGTQPVQTDGKYLAHDNEEDDDCYTTGFRARLFANREYLRLLFEPDLVLRVQGWPPAPDILAELQRRRKTAGVLTEIEEVANSLMEHISAKQDQGQYLREQDGARKPVSWNVRIFRNPTGRYYDKGRLTCHLYQDGEEGLLPDGAGPYPATHVHPRHPLRHEVGRRPSRRTLRLHVGASLTKLARAGSPVQ